MAKNQALLMLKDLSIDISEFHHAQQFTYDYKTKIFMEKELGFEKSNELLQDEFQIWQWANRWFKPLSKEEFRVNISTSGKLKYFEHRVPEEREANNITIDETKELINNFIDNFTDIEFEKWYLVDKSTESKPNRIDYLYTYQKKNMEIFGANPRFQIQIYGDKIGKFHEYVKLPETWIREYQHQRSLNTTTATIANFFMIILFIIALVMFIVYSIKHKLYYKTGLIFGILIAIINFASKLNSIPLAKFFFNTNQTFGRFYSNLLIEGLIQSISLGILVFVLGSIGNYLYRIHFPKKITLLYSFSFEGMKTKKFFYNIILGFTLAFVFISFQILYYSIALKFGAWSPTQVPYSEMLNTKFPWIFILFAGFIPSITEEFCFRLFSISLLKKITKSKLLAILIPAIIWAFAHSNYPQQPFWIRGIEISIMGILIGVLFYKFGITFALIWHYTADAVLSSIIFIKSGNSYLFISGFIAAIIVLLLLGYNLFYYFKNNGFLSDKNLLNEKFNKEHIKPEYIEEIPSENNIHKYEVLTPTRIKVAFILIILLIFGLFIPTSHIGDFYKYTVSRTEALKTAETFLSERGIDSEKYLHAIAIENFHDTKTSKYILEHTSIDTLNILLAYNLKNSSVYYIRFFQELEKEEYRIYIHPMDNKIVGFEHIIEEEAQIPSLKNKLALFKAEKFLYRKNFNIDDFQLIESFTEKQKNRIDHTFIYESKDGHPANIGEGRFRITIIIKGDEISEFYSSYKIPEKWILEYSRSTGFDSFRMGLQLALIPLILLFFFFHYKVTINFSNIPWKFITKIATTLFVIILIGRLLAFNSNRIYFDTSWNIMLFNIVYFSSQILISLIYTLGASLAVFCVILFLPSNKNIKLYIKETSGFDAVFSSILTISGMVFIFHLNTFIGSNIGNAVWHPELFTPSFLTHDVFIIEIISHILLFGLLASCIYYIIFYLIREFLPGIIIKFVSFVILVLISLPLSVDTIPEFYLSCFISLLLIFWLWLCSQYFLKNNIISYFLTGIGFFIIVNIETMIQTGSDKAIVGAYFLISCLIGIVVVLINKDKSGWQARLISLFKSKRINSGTSG